MRGGGEKHNELKKLGQFFHDFRIGRELTLEEAAGNWSAPTLSRFESGRIDVSTQKAVGLIHRIGMEPQDFLLFPEAPGDFPMRLQPLIETNNVEALAKRKQNFFAANTKENSMTRLAAVLFAAGIHWPESDYRFSVAEEQILADRLTIPENLTPFEWELQSALIAPASHELLMLLWQRTERMKHNMRKFYRGTIGMKLWLGALMDRDFEFLNAIRDDLNLELKQYGQLHDYTDTQEVWHFTKLLEQWAQNPTPEHEQMLHKMIAATADAGASSQAKYFDLVFKRTLQGHPYHNERLVDHEVPIVVKKNPGEVIRSRRTYLGLKRSDIAHERDKSTLRRFETGQTQLSFGSLVRLCGQMAILPTTLLGSMHVTLQGAHRIVNLYNSWDNMTEIQENHLPASDGAKIIEKLKTASQDVAPHLLATQLFILQRAGMEAGMSGFDETSQRATARVCFHRMMKSNHWGMLEYMTLRYMVPLLSLDELTLMFRQVQRMLHKQPRFFGVSFAFEAMSIAFVRITQLAPKDENIQFLHAFNWLLSLDSSDAARWQAMGSLLTALDLLQPTKATQTALNQFLMRCKITGRVTVLAKLTKRWGDLVPKNYFER
ncbi:MULTISPECIES: helix-turn-helix transcriptional regulator [Lacticaseibacillus]|uniref:Helix-turn-helix transcriptional regulator n=1 Tax=Lacticaseibacillus huelsenbergensis TaxID=3035291 RepID=A0ABY8DX55_9LACO|nr:MULTISPECIES: helix-turn-helix transcriptional regulator [Lacticaseibacillus]MDG3062294.1 helix-turn-helix transcriptional regulator [Lacticaseibacillus sp. BCRC 81376]WFB40265.1 helix-turn-helix transcriptional regulator [Lacticaseibacillus huelsenbergensis]